LDTEQWRYIAQISQRLLQDYNQVQRTLSRFESGGFAVSMVEEDAEADSFEPGLYRNRARRHFFRLTAAGVVLRDEWMSRG
jgi:hypothetical protein